MNLSDPCKYFVCLLFLNRWSQCSCVRMQTTVVAGHCFPLSHWPQQVHCEPIASVVTKQYPDLVTNCLCFTARKYDSDVVLPIYQHGTGEETWIWVKQDTGSFFPHYVIWGRIIIIIIIIIIWRHKGETESTIVAAQDQVISTNYFKNRILKEETESKCRLCKQHEQTIDHLTSGCPILAKNEYLMRHDKVCAHLHYSICKTLGNETTDKWYTDMPKPAYEGRDVTMLWNQAVHTDREVTANRPDIIIKNKKRENIHTNRYGNTRKQKCHAKGSGKEV